VDPWRYGAPVIPEDAPTSEEAARADATNVVGGEPDDGPAGQADAVGAVPAVADDPAAGSATPHDVVPVPTTDVLAQPGGIGGLAALPGDDADLLDRVATAIGDIFEDSFGTSEDAVD
jgi:hypothetical protein